MDTSDKIEPTAGQAPDANKSKRARFVDYKGEPLGVPGRFVQVYLALIFVIVYAYALVTQHIDFTYDISMLSTLVKVAGIPICIWLIQLRRRAARPWTVCLLAVNTAFSLIDFLGLGAFADMTTAFGQVAAGTIANLELAGNLICILLMLFSPRLKRTLTHTMGRTSTTTLSIEKPPMRERIRTWAFWRNLLIYFVVFSFLGHWAEMAFCMLIRAGIVMGGYDPNNHMLWDEWLYPFNAEGIAVVLIVMVLDPLKDWLLKKCRGRHVPAIIISFFVTGLVCCSIDFLTGITANPNYELWDYRDMPFNFMGQVCLQNSLTYTIAATLILWLVMPGLDLLMRRIPKHIADGAFWALAGMYGFLAILSMVNLTSTGIVFG